MIPVRIMLKDGEQIFREYIQSLRRNPNSDRPDLDKEQYSKEFNPKIEVEENKSFNSKLDLAKYLEERFNKANVGRNDILGENGLWTWLAYCWLNQLAPSTDDGSREIREDARYICNDDYRDYYRHLIAGPYSIYSLHGEENSRLFLCSPVNKHNDFIEQFASRQFIISSKKIVQAISELYFNQEEKKPKTGVLSRNKKGNIRRFIRIIQQFELTYDIYNMEPEEIKNLLPDEFNEWKR